MSKLKLKFKIEDGNLLYSEDGGCTYELIGVVGGRNGTDGADGTNGTNGQDGRDGVDGVDGVTPTVEIDGNTGEWIINGDNTHVVAIGQSGLIDIGDSSDIGHIGTPSVTKTVVGNKTYLHFHNLKGADGNGPTITAVRDGYQMKFYSNGVLFATVNENIPYTAVPDSHVTVNNTTHQIGWDLGAGNGIEFNGNNQIALKQATNAAIGGMKLGTSSQIDSSAAKTYPIGLNASGQAFVNVPWDGGYTPAPATDANLGCIKIGYTESGKNYPVELDANNKAFVNVPWTDVPTKKNELIYSDDGNTLTTHQLMFTGGLVVDTPEDLALCKLGADVALSEVINWHRFGGSEKDDWYEYETRKSTDLTLPEFTFRGETQDYIFNHQNPSNTTGFVSPDEYSDYDVFVSMGILNAKKDVVATDYIGYIAAVKYDSTIPKYWGLSISAHTMNDSDKINRSGQSTSQHTISVQGWIQANETGSTTTGVSLLSTSDGNLIIPYDSDYNNNDDSHQASSMLCRIKRSGNIINAWFSDPYYTNEEEGDAAHINELHYDRTLTIDLANYTVSFIDLNGTFHTTSYASNATVVEIFDKIATSARRGYEQRSNPGSMFRLCNADEMILDVTPGEDKVYKKSNGIWVVQNTTPQLLFQNGSRIAWNRLTDKIFYNDGGSIYRIGADEKQDVKTSTAKMYLTGILTAPTSDDVPHTGVANSGVYATNGYFHSDNNIECGMETHPSDATSNYTSVPTDPIDIDYTSKKYHIINTNFENNTSNPFIINLKDSGSFEGVREVIIRIHNRSVNNASPIVKVTADTGVTLTNLFDANIVSSGKAVAHLSGDSAELVFTFWGTADVTLKGHLKPSANT